MSPKRGSVVDAFENLVGLAGVFPHENLEVEVLGVEIDEVRVARPGRRRPWLVDRRLRGIRSSHLLRHAADLWELFPPVDLDSPFTTAELAERLRRPVWFAQRVAYCLRLAGAVSTVGKAGNRRIYLRSEVPAIPDPARTGMGPTDTEHLVGR
jgi:hypothetical protein